MHVVIRLTVHTASTVQTVHCPYQLAVLASSPRTKPLNIFRCKIENWKISNEKLQALASQYTKCESGRIAIMWSKSLKYRRLQYLGCCPQPVLRVHSIRTPFFEFLSYRWWIAGMSAAVRKEGSRCLNGKFGVYGCWVLRQKCTN